MDSNNQNDFISIDEIFNILKKEIQLTGGPQSISPNFYQNIANLISTLKHRSIEEVDEEEENKKEKISTQIKSNLLDLYIKSTALLFIYRCKKIFNINKKSNETFDYSN